MEAYTGFAEVYDIFMDNVPYQEWAECLHELLVEQGIESGSMVDLGCGTGSMTECFANMGYDMIGIDYSEEMLQTASKKQEESECKILYLQQDMTELELYGSAHAIISVCDSVNYIVEPNALEEMFHKVYEYLEPAGIFMFDFNTEYKYREVIGDCTIAENREECSFIWENYYHEEEKINEYELSIFVREAGSGERTDSNLYRKFEEVHYQRAYTLAEMEQLVKNSGLEYVAAYDGYTKNMPHEESERILVVARKG